MLSSNQVLNEGRYRIIDQFGSVESGRLYEAYDTVSDTKVVLRETVGQIGKVATAAQIENLKAAFAADAQRLTAVEHPSLLKVTGYFSEIDHQYLVMESCEGSEFASLVSEENAPGMSDIVKWADQLLDGLHYLHTQNPPIIHQGVSPRTARLSSNFKVKLLIVGENKESEAIDSDTTADNDSDLAYRALEQLWLGLDSASQKMIANSFGESSETILRQGLDARTDLYSVGATLYFLLTKTEPTDSLARYLEILDGNDDPLQKPDELDASIPAELSNILMRSLELKREERFSSAADMRSELAKVKVPTSRLTDAISGPPASEVSVEDKALEDEQLLVEKQRMELEAEQKRLEEEHARIEKRKLELEAEKKRQAEMLEAKRLEEKQKAEKLELERLEAAKKAAAEKVKAQQAAEKAAAEKAAAEKAAAEKVAAEKAAAEKVAAEKAAAEKAAAEKARLEAEKARLEKEKAELARKEALIAEAKKASANAQAEVEKLQRELAKENLLDIPAVDLKSEAKVADDVITIEVERPVRRGVQSNDTDFDLYSGEMPSKSFITRPPVLAGLAAVVLATVIGVWMFAGGGAGTKPSPAASLQTAPASEDKQTAPSTETQAPDQSNSAFTSDHQAVVSPPGSETRPELDKQKAKKQPTPQAQTKATPEKKKVTVDDLINDN
jgi:serine/threonine protein kinase